MQSRSRRTTSRLFCLATLMAAPWAMPAAAALSFGPTAQEASNIASDPTSAVTDGVSNLLPTPTPSVSVSTDPVSDAIGDATDAVSNTTSGTAGTASGAGTDATGAVSGTTARGLGPAVPAGAQTSAREGQDPSGCAPDGCGRPDSGGSLGRTIERVLGFLAETGSTLLPWIALAAGLAVLGVILVRAGRRRASSS